MASEKPYSHLRIPDGAPIELKPAGDKGWGMFATRDISRNECILEEKPLFYYSIHSLLHNPEPADEQILKALKELPHEDQLRFTSLQWNSSRPFTSLEDVFFVNQHMRPGEDGDKAAVLLLMSRFNHSCVPNAFTPHIGAVQGTERTASHMFAAVDIPAGAEITFAYSQALYYRPRASRQDILAAGGFECQCPACSHGENEQLVSDLRRTMLLRLRSLLKFEPTSLVVDPELRQAADQLEILHSSRFLYHLLIPCFLEAEGVLDAITMDAIFRDLELFADWFMEPYNAAVAKGALEQETLVAKVNFAWKLWGRTDVSDPVIAHELRRHDGMEDPEEEDCHPWSECNCDTYWDGQEAIARYSSEVD
ncbi:SET domain-containing protein [Apiospora marii]|uniref:SET domain-containing protein n=1 Tax=Apiospora marii TaxID=335849 RepID=A0ABR1R5A4_9PEZI